MYTLDNVYTLLYYMCMGRSKKLRKGIESLERQIQIHGDKIQSELRKPNPDSDLIAKWERDIKGFNGEIEKKAKRLPGGRQ